MAPTTHRHGIPDLARCSAGSGLQRGVREAGKKRGRARSGSVQRSDGDHALGQAIDFLIWQGWTYADTRGLTFAQLKFFCDLACERLEKNKAAQRRGAFF